MHTLDQLLKQIKETLEKSVYRIPQDKEHALCLMQELDKVRESQWLQRYGALELDQIATHITGHTFHFWDEPYNKEENSEVLVLDCDFCGGTQFYILREEAVDIYDGMDYELECCFCGHIQAYSEDTFSRA